VAADGGVQGFSSCPVPRRLVYTKLDVIYMCPGFDQGAKEWLRTLPGLVVCGGRVGDGFTFTSDVWRLNLAELRWEPMPSHTRGRAFHSCCAVRGAVVVLGGIALGQEGPHEPYERTTSVEILRCDSVAAEEDGSCGQLWPTQSRSHTPCSLQGVIISRLGWAEWAARQR
jgi:hypothetical protein